MRNHHQRFVAHALPAIAGALCVASSEAFGGVVVMWGLRGAIVSAVACFPFAVAAMLRRHVDVWDYFAAGVDIIFPVFLFLSVVN